MQDNAGVCYSATLDTARQKNKRPEDDVSASTRIVCQFVSLMNLRKWSQTDFRSDQWNWCHSHSFSPPQDWLWLSRE